jgi:hypothetical protein
MKTGNIPATQENPLVLLTSQYPLQEVTTLVTHYHTSLSPAHELCINGIVGPAHVVHVVVASF